MTPPNSSPNQAPQGAIACLFADMEGSTPMSKALTDAEYKRVMTAYHTRMAKCVADNDGYWVDVQGDGFFATFPYARHALACAIAIQETLRDKPIVGIALDKPEPPNPLAMPAAPITVAGKYEKDRREWPVIVRIGVHKADREVFYVEGEDGDRPRYIDRNVNLASRIIKPGKGGQILVSETAYAEGGLEDPAKWEHWTGRRLKDFDTPETLHELLWDGVSRGEPGERFLPDWFRERNRYIPRPELETSILSRFSVRNADDFPFRLVTLHGFGGIGKTRLAFACCLRAMPLFNGNVKYVRLENPPIRDDVPLKPGEDDERLCEFVAQSVGEQFQLSGENALPTRLPHVLPDRKCLVLLDNFESVNCDRVADLLIELLEKCPNLHLLVTGRSPVNLDDMEQKEPIGGLTDPQARDLFLARVRQKKGQAWMPSQPDEAAITNIIRLTEGHALALEIVAAWSEYATLPELAAKLDSTPLSDYTETPPGNRRADRSPRHKGLRRSLDWSHNLLSDELKGAFARLSLFADAFTRADAEEACDLPNAQIHLKRLQDVSLLRFNDQTGRYTFLRPTLAYARSHFDKHPDADSVQQTYVAYYAQLIKANGNVNIPEQNAVLRAEWRNALRAAELAEQANNYWTGLMPLAFYMGDFLYLSVYGAEAVQLQEAAQRAAERVGSVLGQANCIRSLGDIALRRSEHEQARRLYEQAQPLYQNVGDVLGQANCIQSLGDIGRERANNDEAYPRYMEALRLYERLPEPYSIGVTHYRLAQVAPDAAIQQSHVAAARAAWLSIGFNDLVQEYLDVEW